MESRIGSKDNQVIDGKDKIDRQGSHYLTKLNHPNASSQELDSSSRTKFLLPIG